MITKFYENPNKPITKYSVVHHNYTNSPMLDYYAKKKGVTPTEFERRDAIVKREFANCKYKKGDVVYPFSKKIYAEKGMAQIVGVYKDYHDYESKEWNSKDNAFIVTAFWVDKPEESLFCTVDYLQLTEPTE